MNKFIISLCCAFIVKKKNRHHFRDKYEQRERWRRVHFIHCKNTINTGDLVCGFYKYFSDYFRKYTIIVHDIGNIDFKIINKNDLIIMGGGGLFNSYFGEKINRLIKINDNVILFSIGYNFHYKSNDGKNAFYNSKDEAIDLKKCKLVSIRDYQHPSGLQYVPCATCFIPYITNKYEIKRRIGVIKHFHKENELTYGQKTNSFENFDNITNTYPIEKIIEFIGESEVIITNSYHVCYFSMLMCKKVILDAPFSDKFEYLRHNIIKYSGNLEQDIENSKIYPDFLNESRELVENYLENIMMKI